MSNQYTEPSISGYNSSPPADDGTNTASNEVTWSGIKTKLTDPIKNYVDSVKSNITTAFALNHLNSTEAISGTDTVATGDRGKLFVCTNTFTLTLLACASAGDGFSFAVRNDGSGTITLDGNSSETINGSETVTVDPNITAVLVTDGTEWYLDAGTGSGSASTARSNISAAASGANSDITGLSGITDTTEVSNLNTEAVGGLRVKVVDIGDWDMNATTGVNVAHGLTQANIRDVSVMIRSDDDSGLYNLLSSGSAADSTPEGSVSTITATNVVIWRLTGGAFDNASFDSTSFNRGWVTIWYTQ